MEAGLHRDRRCLAAVALLVADLFVPVVQVHALAVDRDFELLAFDVPEHLREIARHSLDGEVVLPVGRELVLDQHAAPRAERQPFDMGVLRGVDRHVERGERRGGFGADREAADVSGGR